MLEAVLTGRVALVTGVSRRKGIGFAIAQKLAVMGGGCEDDQDDSCENEPGSA